MKLIVAFLKFVNAPLNAVQVKKSLLILSSTKNR